MSETKRVARFDLWIDPVFDRELAAQPDIALAVCPVQGADDRAWTALSQSHVYQISSVKDELPRQWFAGAQLLQRCPDLLCVSTTGAGYDTVDVDACTRAGVAVVNQAGANSLSVAEHALGLMLGVSRRMIECDRRMRRERGFRREEVMGHELRGKTLGIVGIGHVGTQMAALGTALGMPVLATDPLLTPQEIQRRGGVPVALDELLARSDIVSLHCPLDQGTRGMLGREAFARMKRGALFISTARGGIHDEAALLQALRSGHLAGAGLDVWDEEPPPLSHPLLALDNVFATFHTAGVSHEARHRVAAMAAEQVVQVLRGERPPRLVNPQAWPQVAARWRAILGRPAAAAASAALGRGAGS